MLVTLKDANGNIINTAVTDRYGNYLFSDLNNGDYTVEFSTPEGYVPTTQNAGTDGTVDSNGLVVPVTINGADNLTIDSGFYKPVAATYNLGDYVWEDSNKDGIQNSNEVGIEGVTVTLTKPDGTTETTVTGADGKYEFTGLENGEYTVNFSTPAGYEATLVNQGDLTALDSNGTTTTVVINNADDYTIDSGFFKPVVEPEPVPATYNLGDYVWEDSNKDGIQNSNEVGIEGVTVTLTKPDGTTETAVTDANGKYVFTGLENGDYTVDFATPEGYEPTKINVGDDALDSDGASTTVTINNADNYTIDSGFFKPAVEEPTPVPATYNLGDYVWEDSNKDGIQNSNEVGIEGVTVTLTKPDGSTVTTVTDANGKYEFTGLENGDYTVDFTAPEGYEATLVNVGDDALDSDGASTTVTINNADNYTIDSGFYKPVVEPTPEDPTPEEPGTPEKPEEPTTPEEPGTPEKPEEPTTPEEPGTPEKPEVPTTPEEPGTPEKPEEPTTPEEPGTPEKPEVPTTPEEPGTPEKPEVPTTPEEPGTPEKPEVPTTPEEPGTPEKPEVPTTPEEPGTPEKPEVPTTPEEPTAPAVTPAPSVEQPAVEKQEKPSEEASSKEKKEALPDTGETESTNNAPLFGGLFAALGSILLFGRRRKDNKDKQ